MEDSEIRTSGGQGSERQSVQRAASMITAYKMRGKSGSNVLGNSKSSILDGTADEKTVGIEDVDRELSCRWDQGL